MSEINANDHDIERARGRRTILFFATPVILSLIGGVLGGFLLEEFISPSFYWIGYTIGTGVGLISFLSIKHHFVVKNNTTGMLLTLNQLKSLTKKENIHETYGPGTHFSLPWEARFARNNIPVEEVAEDFLYTAICKDGTIQGKGSMRLRPDINNPINYLSGVASVDKDFKDLVVTFITDWHASRTMEDATSQKDKLNDALHEKFSASKVTDFENRFGITVSDVTVSEMLMSEDVQKTRGALNETRVIAEATAILLGFKNAILMNRALIKGKISQVDVDRARQDVKAISGNVDKASVNRFEVDIRGLSPEAINSLTNLLNNPAAASVLSDMANKLTPKKGAK